MRSYKDYPKLKYHVNKTKSMAGGIRTVITLILFSVLAPALTYGFISVVRESLKNGFEWWLLLECIFVLYLWFYIYIVIKTIIDARKSWGRLTKSDYARMDTDNCEHVNESLFTPVAIISRQPLGAVVIKYEDIVWVYGTNTTHRVNGFNSGTTSSITIGTRQGQLYEVCQMKVDELSHYLEIFMDRIGAHGVMPIYGFSQERARLFRNSIDAFISYTNTASSALDPEMIRRYKERSGLSQPLEFTQNRGNRETDYQTDPEYGLVKEKPIYTNGVNASYLYVNSLLTDKGEKLKWKRIGSTSAEGIKGAIDIFESTLLSGQPYKTIYVNMFGSSSPTTVPQGLMSDRPRLVEKQKAQPSTEPAKNIAADKNNTVKATKSSKRFCRFCGNQIPADAAFCPKCGKKLKHVAVSDVKKQGIPTKEELCKARYDEALKLAETGIEDNVHKAYDYMGGLASRNDYPPAMVWVGEYEERVFENLDNAVYWYKQAAELGDGNGARNYADMLMTGRGVDLNPIEAMKYYKIAADKGVPEAMFVMGEFSRQAGNTSNALQFYKQAYKQGYEPAKLRIDQLENNKKTQQ